MMDWLIYDSALFVIVLLWLIIMIVEEYF